MPDAVGVPLMVMVLDAHVAETPAGNPLAPDTPLLDIPVAPVVAIVMLVKAVLIHKVGDEDGVPAVLLGKTVIVFEGVPIPKEVLQLSVPVPVPLPEARFVTETVALPDVVNPVAVKVPVPAVVTVIVAVNPVALGKLLL